ncbi:plant/T31B5-30 protein [Cinnamomum micranthum f. kanehirae]|uniref:Plant/T31B5-30 protein n=1 Tax=Cinnamomum micranthum f. kanehirae TaxID=337451 RepID=A0A3S3Q3S9_9MAGN|nr:plant/T31B5-30 protein [Cinnamomum micranthum f. kanehirae]
MDEVKELQWKRMVEDFSNKGKLSNCISVCDVSGSMDREKHYYSFLYEVRMEVCVALGLLTSELSEEPWRGNVINFSQNPQLHRIEGETLQEKVEFIKRMEWEMDIDFQKVFERILDVAVASKLEEEKMVKRVFVFTDMGFGEVSESSWETDYYAIQRKYEEKGYGSSVPEIVFWNFREPAMPPVIEREKGVVLVHGLSDHLLNIFLDNDGVVNPENVMEEAIAGEEYQRVG